MVRGLLASGMMLAATVEPVTSESDITRYAITQGGLLLVVQRAGQFTAPEQ